MTKPAQLQRLGLDHSWTFYKEALDKTGWTVQDLDIFIPHQTARGAIKKLKKATEGILKEELDTEFIINVQNYGNTATTAHFLALHENFLNGRIRPDQNLQFGIFASGFEIGMATYTMDELPIRYRERYQEGVTA